MRKNGMDSSPIMKLRIPSNVDGVFLLIFFFLFGFTVSFLEFLRHFSFLLNYLFLVGKGGIEPPCNQLHFQHLIRVR